MASTSKSLNTLDLDVLKVIEESIKNESLTYVGEDMLDGLKLTALESLGDQKNLQDFINRKYYALKCLRLLPLELSNDFCLTFYNELEEIMSICCSEFEDSEGFDNLKHYIDSSTVNEKLHLMETIALCLAENNINYSVFEKIPPEEWRKELLIFILFRGCTDFDSVQRVINKINKLTDSEGGAYIVENILELLVNNRHDKATDIQFVNDIFFVANVHPNFLAMLSFDYANVTEMIKQIKMNNLLERYANVPGYEMYIEDFPYFLKYPLDVIQAICAEKKLFELSDLIDLKRILESSDIDLAVQIKLLLRIDPSQTMDKWKYQVSFEIVKNTISEIFSEYENYFRQVNHSDPAINCITNTMTINCTCSKKRTECLLHHSSQCCHLLYVLNKTLARVIFNCSDYSEKVLQTIDIILIGINEAKHIVSVINGLEILEDYNIKFTDVELVKFFLELSAKDYESKIHEYVVDHSFPGTYEKSTDQLLKEIEEMNPDLSRKIKNQYLNVIKCYENKSVLFPDCRAIEFWDRRQIEQWGRVFRIINNINHTDPLLNGLMNLLDPLHEVRNNLHTFPTNVQVTDEEILAVIKRAAKLTVGLDLRTVQLLSVLIMIDSNKGKGRLAQVNTGEGKTLIIAVLSAYNVFKGHKVDVYTSSRVLAIPQSEEFEEFYRTCTITVAHNIFENSRYGSDVIYGTNNSFQRDVLSDEFRNSGVRKKRGFDVAIVDEVDNMLIDGNNWILQLTCDMPAMDYLEVILAAIYIQVKEAASLLVERNGEVFYLSQDNAIDEEGNVLPEVTVVEEPLACSKREFIMQCTESHIRKLIRDTDHCGEIDKNYPEIKIPEHLREVIIKVQLKKWIERAVQAIFVYIKGQDYIINDGKITIVDADNTGVVKRDSHWGAGLHQFLQIKHGARVEQESFTTNYISNVGLFTRYSTKLYGLTGTLGSEETRGFLQTTYNVDSVIIPPFKLKQHLNMKAIIVDNEKAKYIEIARRCITKLKNGQAVLIIMKYITETDALAKVFTELLYYDASKVKLFKVDEDSHVVEKSLKPGDVIITTNIAGRGTDIKLRKDVEKNGGLHVCLTFLPINSRVEQQNIGRTSRKGNKGTSQLVLHDADDNNIEVIKNARGKQEKRIMERASDDVKRIKIKDKIFKRFCDLLNKIKGSNADAKKTELKAVEERFAIWLILNEQKFENDDIFEEFGTFEFKILEDDRRNRLIENPFMHVALGNFYLENKKFEEAIQEYSNAIVKDHHFAEHAYFNRAWAYISKYGHNIEKYNHFIDEAISDLKKARKLIQDKEYSLHLLQTASKSEVFSEQVNHKLSLYSIEKNSIDLAIGPDKDAVEEQLKRLKEEEKSDNLTTDYREKLKETIKNLEESKKDIGVIGRAKSINRNIKIESLDENYMPEKDKKSHKEEIKEFTRNGWMGGFKITEVKPIDWTTVISLLGIGLGQLLLGAALSVFTLGAGASIGMALISEGISDIITAVKDGIINRNFDWATWALMKVISLTISIVCAGFKAIKDAARTAYTGVKNVATTGAKAFTQVTKEGWKIVAKKVGLDLAKGVAKNIVTDLVTYGIDKTILPMIEEAIIEKVRVPIQAALINNDKVTKMLKLDEKNKNHNYENELRKLAYKLLTPENQSKLTTIAKQIATQVADNKGYALTRQICNGLYGMYELANFTSNFISDMNKGISKIEIDKESTKNTSDASTSKQSKVAEHSNATQHDTSEKERNHEHEIDLNKINQEDEQVKLKKKIHTTDDLSTELSGLVSSNMMRILKGDIIAPITQMGVNYSIDKLSSRVTDSLENDLKNYRALKNVIHYQSKGYQNASNQQQTDSVRKVDAIIDDLKNGGPAGLVHLGAISDATDRPIEVYDEKGNHKYTIGDNKKAAPIKIQHHSRGDGEVGHFTLLGGKEPISKATGSNNCVFNCIADQTGLDPNELKNKTIKIMESNKATIAKQVTHIDRLEMYNRSSLLEGGAQYDGKGPKDSLRYLTNSNGVIGFKAMYPGHADKHIPFRGKTKKKLEAISEQTGSPVEVYDANGQLAYIVGEGKGKPIKLEYHEAQGSEYFECFSTKGGKDKPYILSDPDNTKLYEIVGQQTGHKATDLKSSVELQLNSEPVPQGHCIENETKLLKRKKQAFESEQEQAYVLHYALKSEKVKLAMEELNRYKEGVHDGEEFYKSQVTVTAEELNLPRPAYGGDWNKGQAKLKWPIKDVRIVLQHYDGCQNDPNAPVHILTFYPIPPKMN